MVLLPPPLSKIRFNANERRARVNVRWCEHPEGQEGAAEDGGGRWIRPNQDFTKASADCRTQRGRVRVRQGPWAKVIRSPRRKRMARYLKIFCMSWQPKNCVTAFSCSASTRIYHHPSIHPSMFSSLTFFFALSMCIYINAYILNYIGKCTALI